ncbi:MAG: 7-cyano-7-deazaguanine synthase QueC [Deltaproteobacteria bacterium]|nr:7-cyano-7-deazaguanine synthase QueC [Candidatus Tharpella aukensis]
MSDEKKAVVLLSGGLDSATVAAIVREQGFALYCLSFRYGQRQEIEVDKARRLATFFGAREHLVLNLDMGLIGGSALTDRAIEVPKEGESLNVDEVIPVTYVPARNTIFIAYAASWAEVVGARDILIGVNALDYSGYPDCRPEYLAAMQRSINLGTRQGVQNPDYFRLQAPLMELKKSEIIRWGVSLGVDYGMTISCYDPDSAGRPCGLCDSCRLRENAFREAALVDPAKNHSGMAK